MGEEKKEEKEEKMPRRIVIQRGGFSVTHDAEKDRYYFEMEKKRGVSLKELNQIARLAWEACFAEVERGRATPHHRENTAPIRPVSTTAKLEKGSKE